MRVLAPLIGWWGIGAGVAGLCLAIFTFISGNLRHRLVHRRLMTTSARAVVLPGAIPMAVLTLCVALCGAGALVLVIAIGEYR